MAENQVESSRGGPPVDATIVVVGGYGAVGRVVVRAIAERLPGRVVVAGRDGRRAAELAAATRGAALARQADVGRPAEVESLLDGAAVVVMCVERANDTVAQACLSRGIHYVDISASSAVLDSIARHAEVASRNNAAAVLSVGLAPGLTNVLAAYALERLSTARSVDMNVLLGLAGDHGPDSVRWTMARLADPVGRGSGTARAARVRLPVFGRRTVHPFAFADQDTLRSTSGVPATTRMCFDSAAVTRVLFALRSARFFRLLARLGGTDQLGRLASRLRLGDDRFVVHAAAVDGNGARVSVAALGRQECRATGIVTAKIVERLVDRRIPPGIWHMQQIVDADELLSELPAYDISIYEEGEAGWALRRSVPLDRH